MVTLFSFFYNGLHKWGILGMIFTIFVADYLHKSGLRIDGRFLFYSIKPPGRPSLNARQ